MKKIINKIFGRFATVRDGNASNIEVCEDQPLNVSKKNFRKLAERVDRLYADLNKQAKEIEVLQSKSKVQAEEIVALYRRITTVDEIVIDSENNHPNKQEAKPQQNEHNYSRDADKVKSNKKPSVINREYQYLKVADGGRLVNADQVSSYYRCWRDNGKLYFEFYSEKQGIAINNRSTLIEPFCLIEEGSKDPRVANKVVSVEPGLLNEDFSINKKTIIRYK